MAALLLGGSHGERCVCVCMRERLCVRVRVCVHACGQHHIYHHQIHLHTYTVTHMYTHISYTSTHTQVGLAVSSLISALQVSSSPSIICPDLDEPTLARVVFEGEVPVAQ